MKKTTNYYPKISIITCVYNGEKYISKLLDSVLSMGYPNIEHIIVDDGSTDDTEKIVMKYARLYKGQSVSDLYIKYIKQDNMGLGGATNTGLKLITGEYWTWINCDDWYEEKAFFEPVKILTDNKKIDYVHMNGYHLIQSTGKKELIIQNKKMLHFNNRKKLFIDYCQDIFFCFYLYLCRTDSYKKINPTMEIYPSRFTQDVQLVNQIFGVLKGSLVFSPKYTLLIREDRFYYSCRDKLRLDYDKMREESIRLLSIKQSTKRTLCSLWWEEKKLKELKKTALDKRTKDSINKLKELIAIRNNLSIGYRIFLDKKIFLYCLYSLLPGKLLK